MNKTGLIIRREYITRVRKRSFIIMSILGPLLFALIWIIPIWLATREGDEKIIRVLDESGLFHEKLANEGSIKFEYITSGLNDAKSDVRQSIYYGLLYISHVAYITIPCVGCYKPIIGDTVPYHIVVFQERFIVDVSAKFFPGRGTAGKERHLKEQ